MRSFTAQMYNRRQFAPPASDFVNARLLAAAAPELIAVPQDGRYVIFSSGADFYARFGASDVVAAIPNADITDGSAAEFNPEAREIPDGVTHLSLVAPQATVVTMAWYGV
tara:strand:+ start:2640 stop:2969 length:330 start_codon:yes stop_codon:yes gene_type:complete